MTHNWHIRPYRHGDEKQILKLRRTVFGDLDPVRLKEFTWRWQFQNNPSGKAFCFLAESNGEIVGQYVTIPSRFSIHGKDAILAFSCDTMIHPGFRRQGMFSALASELYDSLEIHPTISLVWGFPNDRSLPGFTGKLGWRMLPTIPLMVMPIRPLGMIFNSLPLFNSLTQNPPTSIKPDTDVIFSIKNQRLHMYPIEHFDETFDALWQEHSTTAPVIQVRDSRYLQWRYLSIPEFGYRSFSVRRDGLLLGYFVIRMMSLKGQTFGVLVDLFPFPLESFSVLREIFSFARRFVKAHGGDFLTCLLPRKQTGILKQLGFRKVPEIINPKTWRLGYRFLGDVPSGNLDDWHVTYGDTDVV
ncbi:MAG: GNAT family N-acetyltransferase [Deltaproteobacteria bacterium]|nr:GNAT family N-acetyltransferase [Deltaproteobacteria bacterium]